MQVRSPSPEDPLEKEMATHSSIVSGESHGQRSLTGYSPWDHKESDTTVAIWQWRVKSSSHFEFLMPVFLLSHISYLSFCLLLPLLRAHVITLIPLVNPE